MEQFITFITGDINQTIGIILMFITLGYLGYNAHKKKEDLWDAITGPDHKLQLVEVAMAIWLVLFPIIVLSNIFLGTEPAPAVMFSMDLILVIILGVKKFKDASDVLKDSKEKREEP